MVGLFVHGRAPHQYDYRALIGHCTAHPSYPPEVLLKPFYPVCCIYHWLDLGHIVQVGKVEPNIFIFSEPPDREIRLSPLQTHIFPCLYAHLNRIVLITGSEHFPHIVCKLLFITMPYPGQHIALEVRSTTLECSTRELLTDNLIESRKPICHH